MGGFNGPGNIGGVMIGYLVALTMFQCSGKTTVIKTVTSASRAEPSRAINQPVVIIALEIARPALLETPLGPTLLKTNNQQKNF
jgi:hypothetical protein